MKKLLTAIIILITNSASAEWVEFGSIDNSTYYIEPASKKTGDRPRVWMLQKYSKPNEDGIFSKKILFEADCKQGKMRYLSVLTYSDLDSSKQISQIHTPSDPIYFPPDSFAAMIFTYLCGKAP